MLLLPAFTASPLPYCAAALGLRPSYCHVSIHCVPEMTLPVYRGCLHDQKDDTWQIQHSFRATPPFFPPPSPAFLAWGRDKGEAWGIPKLLPPPTPASDAVEVEPLLLQGRKMGTECSWSAGICWTCQPCDWGGGQGLLSATHLIMSDRTQVCRGSQFGRHCLRVCVIWNTRVPLSSLVFDWPPSLGRHPSRPPR